MLTPICKRLQAFKLNLIEIDRFLKNLEKEKSSSSAGESKAKSPVNLKSECVECFSKIYIYK